MSCFISFQRLPHTGYAPRVEGKGADLSAVSGDMAFLLVFMVLMLVLASVSFKRTL
ncbi:MAG TPA: hypothetical protein VEY94_01435 [Patescibacteria group bacterium]|nr:hypothetical protein [Patescibacteria group bacterium]